MKRSLRARLEHKNSFVHSYSLMKKLPFPIHWPARSPAAIIFALMMGAALPATAQDTQAPTSSDTASSDITPSDIDRISDIRSDAPNQRTRIYLGPQIGPAYPGADRMSWRPYFDLSRAREGEFFAYEAPDESFGFNFYERGGSALGLAANFVGKRKARDTDGLLPSVGWGAELGVSGQTWVLPNIRLRAEARKAISGHKAFVGNLSADYVKQESDNLLISFGPRISLADGKFARTYYGISPRDAQFSGLPAYRPKGGIQSIGAAASLLYQFDDRWGMAAYARYERLLGDAASSPVTREFGSRNQPSVGVALSYTFAGDIAR